MANTWAFYAAIVLALIAVGIIIALFFLLYSPKRNSFDSARGQKKTEQQLQSQLNKKQGSTPKPFRKRTKGV